VHFSNVFYYQNAATLWLNLITLHGWTKNDPPVMVDLFYTALCYSIEIIL